MPYRFFLVLFLFLFNTSNIFSQTEQEYYGVLKLNDTAFITYKLNLIEKFGLISGHSITDIGGEHETKSSIKGFYNSKTNNLIFKEEEIIYTKSKITEYDFCFVHFDGSLKEISSKKNIKGKFSGRYSDNTSCIDGEILLNNVEKIEKKIEKVEKFIKKTKKIDEETKSKINIRKTLDSLKTNILRSNQNLSMFSRDSELRILILDAGKVDGDRINVYINDTLILKNYTVTKEPKKIIIPLKSKFTNVKFQALNTGEISPNTAKIELIDSKNNIRTISSLSKNEKTSITIIKIDN
jgi:hypothetical protein